MKVTVVLIHLLTNVHTSDECKNILFPYVQAQVSFIDSNSIKAPLISKLSNQIGYSNESTSN